MNKDENITELLLLAAHGGTYMRKSAAILMCDHCLPIACSRSSYGSEDSIDFGLHALWEATSNVEEFFNTLNREAIITDERHPAGLWVYEISYEPPADEGDDGDGWQHLSCGGSFRRPTLEELEPFARGEAPWGGVVL